MDASTSEPHHERNAVEEDEPEAYFKLAGPDLTWYAHTLPVHIGRKLSAGLAGLTLPDQRVSRHHATIDYDHQRHTYVLTALGKNGVQVNGDMHRPAEGSVPLRSRDAIRIGSKAFYFLLPLAQLQRMHGQGADAAKENPPPFKTSQLLEKAYLDRDFGTNGPVSVADVAAWATKFHEYYSLLDPVVLRRRLRQSLQQSRWFKRDPSTPKARYVRTDAGGARTPVPAAKPDAPAAAASAASAASSASTSAAAPSSTPAAAAPSSADKRPASELDASDPAAKRARTT